MNENELNITNQAGSTSENVGNEPIVPLEAGKVTPEQLDALQQRAAKADENWDRLLRTMADLENYRKRATRDKQDAIKFANESLLAKLMPVLDSFDNALAAADKASGDSPQALRDGVAMIYQQLRQVLQEAGLEEVEAPGKPFDPNFHEAIAQQESSTVPDGQVLQQLRKGYKLRERLLRAASVIVAKKPA